MLSACIEYEDMLSDKQKRACRRITRRQTPISKDDEIMQFSEVDKTA
jgi:hypothetical protein